MNSYCCKRSSIFEIAAHILHKGTSIKSLGGRIHLFIITVQHYHKAHQSDGLAHKLTSYFKFHHLDYRSHDNQYKEIYNRYSVEIIETFPIEKQRHNGKKNIESTDSISNVNTYLTLKYQIFIDCINKMKNRIGCHQNFHENKRKSNYSSCLHRKAVAHIAHHNDIQRKDGCNGEMCKEIYELT